MKHRKNATVNSIGRSEGKKPGKIQSWQKFMTAHPDDDVIQKEMENMKDLAPLTGCNKAKIHKNDMPKTPRHHCQ